MKISPNIGVTLIDYPGKVAFEIYTSGCNYRCPTCHSKSLVNPVGISGQEAIKLMKEYKNRDWINGLAVCGGEPTLHSDLPDFLRDCKKQLKLAIKLDTNGSNPVVLGDLLEEKLVDYIALDIKGSPGLYRQLIGDSENCSETRFDFRDNLEKAINGVQNFPGYELRTTIVPYYSEDGKLIWMNAKDADEMAEYVKGFIFTDPKKIKWYIQKFVARKKADDAMMDDKFAQENLPREYHETPLKVLEAVRDEVRKKFPLCEIR